MHSRRILALVTAIVFSSPSVLAQPTLREKIGQMIMVTFTGDSLEKHTASVDTLIADIVDKRIGGVIFFTWSNNLKSPGQIRHLTDGLQGLTDVPLLIATDQEGGYVARLSASNGFLATQSAYSMGTTVNTEANTRTVSGMMAGWFEQTGINMNLAPVVDVNVNPTSPAIGAHERSFSASAAVVAQHAGWFMDEFNKKNVVTTLKHFPGHGSAVGDSHLGFTDVTDTWGPVELEPFQQLIDAGNVKAIMTAHVYNADLDSVFPATLSQPTMTGILREQMGFNGVILSDAMSMGAITAQFGFEESVVQAIHAGVDILLYTRNLETDSTSLARKLVNLIEARVLAGQISAGAIESSYVRIMALKQPFVTSAPVLADALTPESFHVGSFPNPFNGSSTITISAPFEGRLSLVVYDLLGRAIESLHDDKVLPGTRLFRWSPRDRASGMYLLRVTLGRQTATHRLVYVR